MAGAGMVLGTTMTKVIVEIMAEDMRGEVEEKISQDQGNSHFLVLFLIFLSTIFRISCGVLNLRLNFLLIW